MEEQTQSAAAMENKANVDAAACSEAAMRDMAVREAAAAGGRLQSVAVMHIDYTWFRCSVCCTRLQPPVFQCNSGHLACGGCRAGQCRKCEPGAGAGGSFDARNTVVESIVSLSEVQCPHSGCRGYFTFRDLGAHLGACPHAPCSCRRCGFAGPPTALFRHLASAPHSWPAHFVQYDKPLRLRVPAASGPPGPRGGQMILAEDDGRVFTLLVGALGVVTVVSLVCVRTGLPPWPDYKASLRADGPGGASRVAMETVTSSRRPGEVAVDELPCILTVPPTYLIAGDAPAHYKVSLSISIKKPTTTSDH